MYIEDYCDQIDGALVLRDSLQKYMRKNILSCDTTFTHQLDMLDRLADSNVPFIIHGEAGCGKDSVAQYAHAASSHSQKPLYKINCAYLPEGDAANELFGRGNCIGFLESSAGCSLYIENISFLSIQNQYRLMERIHEQESTQLHTHYMISLHDTPSPPNGLIEPLIDYFSAMTFLIPPLRDRRTDILLLTMQELHHILERYRIERKIGPELMHALLAYDWPGNTRQLIKVIDRMAFMSDITLMNSVQLLNKCLSGRDELFQTKTELDHSPEPKTLKELVLDYEVKIINQYIEQYGSLRKAASALGVSHSVLSEKLTKYNSTSFKKERL